MSLYFAFLILPVLFCLTKLLVPRQSAKTISTIAIASGLVIFGFAVYFHFFVLPSSHSISESFRVYSDGLQLEFQLDSVSSLMVLLTTVLTLGVYLAAPSLMDFKNKEKEFYVLVSLMQVGLLATYLAYDLISFYVAWEVVLIPAFLLIGIFGGENRIKATIKFFLYTLAGSLFMLIAFALLMKHNKSFSESNVFLFSTLYKNKLDYFGIASDQGIIGLCLLFAFFVKAPLIGFHGWLRDTYLESPTLITVLIAGVMGKMGIFGLIRFMPMFPGLSAEISSGVMLLAAIGVVIGIFTALQAKQMKEVIAYVSLSHVNALVFGLFTLNQIGISGSIIQMFSHGLLIGGLFLVYAYLEKNSLLNAKGLSKVSPFLASCFFVITLGAVALPMTNGFVGESMIFFGGFASNETATYIALTGTIFGAIALLRIYSQSMFGETSGVNVNQNLDVQGYVKAYLLVLSVVVVVTGIYPHSVFIGTESFVSQSMNVLLSR